MNKSNPFGQLMALGVKGLHTLTGCPTFVWGGVTYPCALSSLRTGTEIDFGGRLYQIKLSLSVTTQALSSAAQPMIIGQLLTVSGEQYRVAVIIETSGGGTLRIDLISPNSQR